MYSSKTLNRTGSTQFGGSSPPVPKVKKGEILVKQTYWDYDEFMNPKVTCPQKKSYYKVMSKDEFSLKQEICKDLEQKRKCILQQLGKTGGDAAFGKYQQCLESASESSEDDSSTLYSGTSSQDVSQRNSNLNRPPPPPLPQLRDRMEAERVGRSRSPQDEISHQLPRPRPFASPPSLPKPIRSVSPDQSSPQRQSQARETMQNTGQYPMPRRSAGLATRSSLHTSRPTVERTLSGQIKPSGFIHERRSVEEIPFRTCPTPRNSRLPQQPIQVPQQIRSQPQEKGSEVQLSSKLSIPSASQICCQRVPSQPKECLDADAPETSCSRSSMCTDFLPQQFRKPATEGQQRQQTQQSALRKAVESVSPSRPNQIPPNETNGGFTLPQRPQCVQQQQQYGGACDTSLSQGHPSVRGVSSYPSSPKPRHPSPPSTVPLVPQKATNYPPPKSPTPIDSQITTSQPPFECREDLMWEDPIGQDYSNYYEGEDFGECNNISEDWGEEFANCQNDPMIYDEEMPNICDDDNLELPLGLQRPDPKVQIIIQIPQITQEQSNARSNYGTREPQYGYAQSDDFQSYGYQNSEADPNPIEEMRGF